MVWVWQGVVLLENAFAARAAEIRRDRFLDAPHHLRMRLLARLVMLAFLPMLSGCFTNRTMDLTKDYSQILPDKVDRIEKAFLTDDNYLFVLVDAHLGGIQDETKFTFHFPLSQFVTTDYFYGPTNAKVVVGKFTLTRSRADISPDWPTNEIGKIVPLGKPFVIQKGNYINCFDPNNFQLLPNAHQTAYLISGNNNVSFGDGEPMPITLIYVDDSDQRPFNVLQILQDRGNMPGHKSAYLLLPFAVAGDIVCLPFYGLIYLIYGNHC